MTPEEIQYLRDRLSDANLSLIAHARGFVQFPKGELCVITTLKNCLDIVLKHFPSEPSEQ